VDRQCALPQDVSRVLTGGAVRTLLWLAMPVLAEQLLNTLVHLVDLFLARYVGPDATTSVGLAGYFNWFVGVVYGFIGAGATALVARSFGYRGYQDANRFTNQAIGLSIVLGVAAAAGVIAGADWIPGLFGLTSDAAQMTALVLRIQAFGHFFSGALFIGNACLRGGGDTRTPLGIMAVVNLVNILISVPLALGVPGLVPRLGVAGIAAGTAAALTIGGFLVLLTLLRGRAWYRMRIVPGSVAEQIRLRAANLRPHAETIKRLLRIGIPAGLDGFALWFGHLAFLNVVTRLATGDEQTATVAAHITGIRIEALSYLPAFAWGTAAATMVGQALGARAPGRAAKSGHIAAAQAALMTGLLGVVYFTFAGPLYWFFSGDPRVMTIGVPAFRLLAFFQIPLGVDIVYRCALRGAGDTRYPLMFTLIGTLGIRVPVAYVCGPLLGGGLVGAWIGMCSDLGVRVVLSAWRFTQGGWKRISV
jgi:putative MATE family efflux protein